MTDKPLDFVSGLTIGGGGGGSTSSSTSTFDYNKALSEMGAESIDRESLAKNPDHLNASRILYKWSTGQDFQGSDQELADYGLEYHYHTYNLTTMGVDGVMFSAAPEEPKKALAYILTEGEKLGWSYSGFYDAAKWTLTDPLTYAGLATFGIGTVTRAGAGAIAKETFLQAAKRGFVVGATEGAIFGAAQSSLQQNLEITTGKKDEFSYGELAANTAAGAGIGSVVGGALEGSLAALFRQKKVSGTTLADPATKAATDAPSAPVEPSVEAPSPTGTLQSANDNAVKGTVDANHIGVITRQPMDGLPTAANSNLEPGMQIWDGKGPTPANQNVLPDSPAFDGNTVLPGMKSVANDNPIEAPAAFNANAGREARGSTPANVERGATNSIIEEVKAVGSAMVDLPPTFKSLFLKVSPVVEEILTRPLNKLSAELQALKSAPLTSNEDIVRHASNLKAAEEVHEMYTALVKDIEENLKVGTPERLQAQKLKEDLYPYYRQLEEYSRGEGSLAGYSLGMRRGGTFIKPTESFNRETVAAEMGIDLNKATVDQKQAIDTEVTARFERFKMKRELDQAYQKKLQEIQTLGEAGDTAGAARLKAELDAEDMVEAERQGLGQATLLNTVAKGAAEVAIANVFSPKSLVANIIPNVIKFASKPFLDVLVKGGSRESFTAMAHQYSQLFSGMNFYFRAARMNFKLETSLLTRDFNALSDGFGPTITKRYGIGGLIRLLPRINGAVDEYFKQVAYRQYVVTQAVSEAYQKGVAAGLSKSELNKLVKEEVQAYIAKAYEDKLDYNSTFDLVMQDGVRRGLKGEKLIEFTTNTIKGNEDLFFRAKNEVGRDFAADQTFNRAFSGEGDDYAGTVSKLAKGYEHVVNRYPMLRLMGQLFFRTPVRVFEEGIRLTPGLNLIAPRFIRDLRGKGRGGFNGPAYYRAQGELMMGFGMAAWFMTQYAQGNITGGGSSDWRQRRDMENAKDWKPYTLRIGGQELNYRNLDPFATPIKIMANAMDNYMMLLYREQQGEKIQASEFNKVASLISVGGTAVVQAIKDANLTQGISEISKLSQELFDPEQNEDAIGKFFASKIRLAVPSTFSTIMRQDATDTPDPLTLEQFLLTSINPADSRVSRRYDATGNTIKLDNPMAGIIGIDLTTEEDRLASLGDKRAYVNAQLRDIALARDVNFQTPYRVQDPGFSGLDLRKQPTADGSMSLWDAYNQEIAKIGAVDMMYDILKQTEGMPVGTPGANEAGPRFTLVSQQLNLIRKIAWENVKAREAEAYARNQQGRELQFQSKAGQREVGWLPYQR